MESPHGGAIGIPSLEHVVDGVSLVLTLRQEFVAVIEQRGGGVSTLNRMLREKLGGSQLHDETVAALTGSLSCGANAEKLDDKLLARFFRISGQLTIVRLILA
jgi:ABC-type phosphate/phosphonate transport system ATPase subunit